MIRILLILLGLVSCTNSTSTTTLSVPTGLMPNKEFIILCQENPIHTTLILREGLNHPCSGYMNNGERSCYGWTIDAKFQCYITSDHTVRTTIEMKYSIAFGNSNIHEEVMGDK